MGSCSKYLALPFLLAICGCDSDTSGAPDASPASDTASETIIVPADASVSDQAAWLDGTDDTQASADLAPGCGNGVREIDEQCDDGNQTNLDGCDSECRFEQVHRINQIELQYGIDAFCSKNAFGNLVKSTDIRNAIQGFTDSSLKSGTITVLFKWFDLDDLSGTDDPSASVGMFSGQPVKVAGYSGLQDLDWWYTVDPGTIDDQRNPIHQIPVTIDSKSITAGPGSVAMAFNLVGTLFMMQLVDTTLTAPAGPSSTPLLSDGGPPGHLAEEHLDPQLASFDSLGVTNTSIDGRACGKLPAHAIKNVPPPQMLLAIGCAEGYTSGHSVLDLFVGGCTIFSGLMGIYPTQPDSDDPDVPPVGAGPPYTLIADAQHFVTSCTDKDGNPVSLIGCLKDATYSMFFKFAAGRVIVK